MTPSWLHSEVVLRAATALKDFLWQGAMIAAVYAAADALLARSAPRARYAVACAALAAMLAAPVYTFATATRPRPEPASPAARGAAPARSAASPRPVPLSSGGSASTSDAIAAWIVAGWAAGVVALSARLAAACVAVERLRRRRSVPAAAALEARLASVAARMRVSRPVRLLESAAVRVPSAVGALRPAILLPAGIASGLTAGQLDALLAHELAHVARRDYFVHLLQALAETVLFFHPAVWWVSHRIRVEREHACDDLAVAATGDALVYARALLTVEESRLGTDAVARLAVAANGGALSARIRRLLSTDAPRRPLVGAALALSSALALGAAAHTPDSEPLSGQSAPAPSPEPAPTPRPATPATPVSAAPAKPASTIRPAASPQAAPRPAPPAKPERAGGLLTPDELIAFRIHDVTPEFIAAIRAEGFERATPDEIVALRVHDVTPEYIRKMTAVLGRQPLEDYAAFKIHGLTPETVGAMRDVFGQLSPDDALALRIHGATPEFAKEMRAAGLPNLTADEAVAFRIHGVTADFVRETRALDLGLLTADDLVAFRIHGVTAEFARAMRGLGIEGLGADELVAFRIHGVTPEFVKEIQALGYARISADDLVAFRIHGVTPQQIREMNAREGARLSPDELLDRRIHGDDYEEDPR